MRGFLAGHEVRTVVEMNWPPQLENGDLLNAAEMAAFDVMVPRTRTSGTSKISQAGNSPWLYLGRTSGRLCTSIA